MSEARGQLVGEKYQLIEEVGAGGMGSVWRARHVELEVDVALKRLSPQYLLAPHAIQRFRREARAAARMRHPNIVHIFDYGVEDGVPYMAMELLEGEDLGTLLEREDRLAPGRILDIVRPVCKALKHAHEAGLVHRDLKPSNIFLSRQGGEEIVKILDFGVVKEAREDGGLKTGSDVLLGTPLYMSPEQTKAATLDGRSDLWSMGVVIFELATGANPFLGASLGDVFGKISWEPLPVPSEWEASLPPSVDTFMSRALARRPDDRFADASELLAAWEAVVEGRPQSPAPVPAIGRGRHEPTGALVVDKMADTLPLPPEQALGEESPPANAISAIGTSVSHPPLHVAQEQTASAQTRQASWRGRGWAALVIAAVVAPIAYFVVTGSSSDDGPGVVGERGADAFDETGTAANASEPGVTPIRDNTAAGSAAIATADASAVSPGASAKSAPPTVAKIDPTPPIHVPISPSAKVSAPPMSPPPRPAPEPKSTATPDPVFGVEVKK